MADRLKIGEAARAASCAVDTVRYYENEGLLPRAARSQGNYRLYDSTHVARLSFIRHCRSLDMTLEEIRLLLRFCDRPDDNCDQVNALLEEHIDHVAERIAELLQLQKQLKDLRRLCGKSQAVKNCGILNELAQTPANRRPEKKRAVHVHGTHSRRGTR